MSTMTDPVTGETFTYFERAEWGARPPRQRYPMAAAPNGIYLHHTAGGTEPGIVQVRGAQNMHMDVRKWHDIAYSFLVTQAGHIFEGRGFGVVGGHTENRNSTSHAICFVGNSETDVPTPAALRAIKCVQQNIEARFGVHGFRGHRDAPAATKCPGANLYRWVQDGAPYPPGTPTPAPMPNPFPPTEDPMPKLVILADHKTGRHYIVREGDIFKHYISSPDHIARWVFFGAENRAAQDGRAILEMLAEV